MEKDIFKLSINDHPKREETLCTSNDGSSVRKLKTSPKKKEVNSWDCSTSTNNEKTSKKKVSDWDSSSECQETMVEPFDNNDNLKDCDNWDTESEKDSPRVEIKEARNFLASSLGSVSYDLSIADLSDLEKSSLMDIMGSGGGRNGDKTHSEDLLLVEDLEEFLRDDNSPKVSKEKQQLKAEESPESPGSSDLATDSEKVRSNRSEGTREETTIWMIPKSERTQSGESTSKLISSSDREKIQKLKVLKNFLKKTKSLSDVQKSKIRRRTAKSSRSDNLGSEKSNYSNFITSEGSTLQRKLEIELKKAKEKITGCENFDRSSVFFTEYECRTMTVEKDTPDKQSIASTTVINGTETVSEVNSNESTLQNVGETNQQGVSEMGIGEVARAGPSENVFSDVMSLPDMTHRTSLQEPKKSNHWLSNSENGELNKSKLPPPIAENSRISESWFLLDSSGHYQPVSRNEVSILLNGRSADAVLQGMKEHFIPNATLADTKSLRDSLSCIQTKESFQNFLKEEDIGGEDVGRKSIELERKVENTLFYIQPNMNFTASIRIIPVESEMIHIWKRTRDSGSLISSEVDLSHPSLDSVETSNQRNVDPQSGRRLLEQAKPEQEDFQSLDRGQENQTTDYSLHHSRATVDYSRLLMETRTIVDSLSDNFKTIQKRLDGETNRSMALQGEVDDLKVFLKKFEKKFPEKNSREIISDVPLIAATKSSLQSLKDKSDVISKSIIEENEESTEKQELEMPKEEKNVRIVTDSKSQTVEETNTSACNQESDIITVNIYTVDSASPIPYLGETTETYSLVQSNLTMIENKMRRLQQENEILMKQNLNLKRKLREISMELEKYLAGTSQPDASDDETKELDPLRDQVCNLKLELENLKNKARLREEELTEENSLIQQEFAKILFSLKDWCVMAGEVFEKLETAENSLKEIGITLDVNLKAEMIQNPKHFSNLLVCFVQKIVNCLTTIKNEFNSCERNVNRQKDSLPVEQITGLDQVISGYAELIDQCRKGQMTNDVESKVMEDYFAVIMEKASLTEEIKILKTENEMLLESQMEHYEKLKQTMIALKDRKSDINALTTSQKLSDDERVKMADMLKLCEEEKREMKIVLSTKDKTIDDLIKELERKHQEINNFSEKLKSAVEEIRNFEKSSRLKDELISEMKMEKNELLNADLIKNDQIEILMEKIRHFEMRETELEAEMTSTKLFLNDSQKEMTDYITHLETLVSNSQDSIDKTKQKLKECHQTINRLKNENDILDKQHQCDVKLFNQTKDELDSCKENLLESNAKLKELQEERIESVKKLESVVDSEKEKSEALEILAREYKNIVNENSDLKEKVEIYSREREESLKEQKDLINRYAILSKEIQKLEEKYRSVKRECNQRTDLITYLEIMLKENLVEYNSRIACLEQNISRIVEKIVACKNGFREKHFGLDAEVKELRHQLEVTYQERNELENVVDNYCSMMKRLENEIQEREKTVDELHVKLSLEQQKATKCDNATRSCNDFNDFIPNATHCEYIKTIEQLESQIEMTENELAECKKELHHCRTNNENERKKLELIIADLKSEVKRYQLRLEVMMRNLTNSNKNQTEKSKNQDNSEIQTIAKELQEKNKLITELNDVINKHKSEIALKENDLENSQKKNHHLSQEVKSLQNEISQMQEAIIATKKTNEIQQKERDEMAEKLLQSIKLIMEEKSTRQTIESLAMEKEKNYKNDIDQMKNELILKGKECATLSETLEEKKKLVIKLQNDLKKIKCHMTSLKGQVSSYRRGNGCKGNGDNVIGEEQVFGTSEFLGHLKTQNVSNERLESSLKELKEVRDINLQLRKAEGQFQAKIVRLEDEIRDARLLIKELQGDIKTEKKSKNAFKNMILAAKMEVEKCLLANQLMSVVAEKINRHLDMSEIPSRELLSGFRLSDSSCTSKICS